MSKLPAVACCLACLLVCAEGQGENWPGWRGPRGDGSSEEQNVPVRWDATNSEGLVWKVPLAGSGHAQPVIWEDRILSWRAMSPRNGEP
jgi:outer membrane protein assembly factor BamB